MVLSSRKTSFCSAAAAAAAAPPPLILLRRRCVFLLLLFFFFFFFCCCCFFGLRASSQGSAVSFSYPNDPTAEFFLLGDAVESHGVIQLTTSPGTGMAEEPPTGPSTGRFLCRKPIRMRDPGTSRVASFSTSFTFRISTPNSSYSGGGGGDGDGDGMAFVITPDNSTLGEGVGVFTPGPDGGGGRHALAVEFDTRRGGGGGGGDVDRVGVDVGDAGSSRFRGNASGAGIRLGAAVTSWVRYDAGRRSLQVRISADAIEPLEPLIDAQLGLAAVLPEWAFVGFSGSAGPGSGQLHELLSWAFSSWGIDQQQQQEVVVEEEEGDLSATGGGRQRHLSRADAVLVPVCTAALTLLVFALGLVSWRMACARRKKMQALTYFRRTKPSSSSSASSSAMGASYPRPFSYKELHAATRGFGEQQRLPSDGGAGRFFKGVLTDSGAVVAVKRIPRRGGDRDANDDGLLLEQLGLLVGRPHRNLVPVQGWCLDNKAGELLLVYEFMPNESLEKYLFAPDERHEGALGWSHRYNIVLGVAEGLAHMHEGGPCHGHHHQHQPVGGVGGGGGGRGAKEGGVASEPCRSKHVLLHRDVKASNVMLDNNFNARLGDYGLGRLVSAGGRRRGGDKERSMVLEGTFGYVAPEVVETGKMSAEADVFSFGVLVLEVACGRRAIAAAADDGDERVLMDDVWERHGDGRLLGAADPRLNGCFDVPEMECLLRLGLLCTLPDPGSRPSMSEIRSILRAERPPPPFPVPPPRPPPPSSSSSIPDNANSAPGTTSSTTYIVDEIHRSLQISIDQLLSS